MKANNEESCPKGGQHDWVKEEGKGGRKSEKVQHGNYHGIIKTFFFYYNYKCKKCNAEKTVERRIKKRW
jgi:hypothetical protein